MKTPAERGTIGAWAYQARDDAGLSVPQVLEQLTARGAAVTDSTIRGIEGGSKKPGRRLLRELAATYGSVPPGAPDEPPAALADLVSAIGELVEEIRQERAARVKWERGLAGALQELVELVRPRAPSADPAPQPRAGARR
jgi:transcriptional regulator with XRE-family HTH domain